MRPLSLLLLLCLLHGWTAPIAAQEPPLPGWVVPVLRLVSSTHVEPTTGIVLSADGLVLVPADFAAPGDEIVVLDGGRDIVRNGRPARLEFDFPELGLEVLRVEGLNRSGAPIATALPNDGDSVVLRAFPPAEQIAEGAPPLNASATLAVPASADTATIAADTPLPNVTGPLLDECGNLVGLSLADGVQTLAPSADARHLWLTALRAVLAQLRLPVSGSDCSNVPPAEEQPPLEVSPAAPEEVMVEPPASDQSAKDDEDAEAGEPRGPDTAAEHGPSIERLPPHEEGPIGSEPDASAASRQTASPSLWWLSAALLLLLAGGIVHLVRRNRLRASQTGTVGDSRAQATEAEIELVKDSSSGDAPNQPDCQLVLRGQLPNGRPFTTGAAVNADAIGLVIGRGAADLVIDSPSVSRRHARLSGTAGELTLSDLGSSNGSSINGIPCLEGEVMYLEPGDTVLLGDARFTLDIEALPTTGDTA